MPMVKEMTEMVNDFAAAGYEVVKTPGKNHHRVINPFTGQYQVLAGGKAMGVMAARTRLVREGFMTAEGKPVPLPERPRTQGETRNERMARLLKLAQDCTGEQLPDDWLEVGDAHDRQACACFRPSSESEQPMATTATTTAKVSPRSNGNGMPSAEDVDEAIKLLIESEPKTIAQIHQELLDQFGDEFIAGSQNPTLRTSARVLGLVRKNAIYEASRRDGKPMYLKGTDPHAHKKLTTTEWLLLDALKRSGGHIEDRSGRATTVLVERCEASLMPAQARSVTMNVAALAERGLVKRKVTGKRTFSISITQDGRHALNLHPTMPPLSDKLMAKRGLKGRGTTDTPSEAASDDELTPSGTATTTPPEADDLRDAAPQQPTAAPQDAEEPAPAPEPTAAVATATGAAAALDPSRWSIALEGHGTVALKMPLGEFARMMEQLGLA